MTTISNNRFSSSRVYSIVNHTHAHSSFQDATSNYSDVIRFSMAGRTVQHKSIRTVQHKSIRTVQHKSIRTVQYKSVRTVQYKSIRTVQHKSIRTVQHKSVRTVRHKNVRTSHLLDTETDLLDHSSQENSKCSLKQSKDEIEEKQKQWRKRKMRT